MRDLQQGFTDAVAGPGDAAASRIEGAGLEPSARPLGYRNAVAATLGATLHDSGATAHARVADDFLDAMAAHYRQ